MRRFLELDPIIQALLAGLFTWAIIALGGFLVMMILDVALG